MAVQRSATAVWKGTLFEGSGTFTVASGVDPRARRYVAGAHRELRRQDESRGTGRRRARVVFLDGPVEPVGTERDSLPIS